VDLKSMRKKSPEDLLKHLNELRQKLVELRKKLVMGEETDISQTKKVRSEIARILTIIREKSEES
jgi:ribosomal protein L29